MVNPCSGGTTKINACSVVIVSCVEESGVALLSAIVDVTDHIMIFASSMEILESFYFLPDEVTIS
jgi:hypothetical protein